MTPSGLVILARAVTVGWYDCWTAPRAHAANGPAPVIATSGFEVHGRPYMSVLSMPGAALFAELTCGAFNESAYGIGSSAGSPSESCAPWPVAALNAEALWYSAPAEE